MQIVGTSNLWKDYFADALPFNITELSKKTIGNMTARELYFDGLPTTDGRVRAFVRIFENPDPKGVILLLPNHSGGEDGDIAMLFNHGYTVAMLDYTGETDKYPRFTFYPASLSGCNAFGKTKFVADSPALQSCWFVWTAVARRAVLLLKHLYEGKKLFAVGKGLGGSIVYKLCSFDDGLTAAATMLNVIPDVSGTGNFIINYRAALDSSSYSQTAKIPLFMAVASNDEDGSLDQMSTLAENTASLKCFRIVERTFSSGIKKVFGQIDAFFTSYDVGTPNIPRPKVTASNSENRLYFNIKVSGGKVAQAEMFAAFCIENPTHRNWTKLPVITVAEDGEYMARADVLQNDKPAYAFINVKCEDGSVSSSPLLCVVPKMLGIPAVPRMPHRLIYDGSMGLDVWTSADGGNVEVKTGPYGIDGVCSDTLSLATFKPGDMMYRGEKDSLLQLSVSGKQQSITVSVSDGVDKYDCIRDIPSVGEWHKFTLSSSDFKNVKSGTLNNWLNVIMLEISSKDELIVGSALWV
ncbi:MAG: hypothetical protein J1G04_01520 [Clostridiales bacterium]|nr:hypothetical protein [Clostridiales bacterium]